MLFKIDAETYIELQGGKLAGKTVELIVKDKVDDLGGFVFTPNAMAVAPLIQQSQTSTVVFNAATSALTDKSELFLCTSYTLWQVTMLMAQSAAKNKLQKVVTTVTD